MLCVARTSTERLREWVYTHTCATAHFEVKGSLLESLAPGAWVLLSYMCHRLVDQNAYVQCMRMPSAHVHVLTACHI